MGEEDFFSKLKNKCPSDEERERTKEIIKQINIENGEHLPNLYCKSDVILSADMFEKFIKVLIKEFDINPLYSVSLHGYAWQCGKKYTDNKKQTLQDKDMILLHENIVRGRLLSIMSDRYVTSDENKKIMYIDANGLYGHSTSQLLPFDEIKFDRRVKLKDLLKTRGDSDFA